MDKIIGIISYLPPDPKVREYRQNKLICLLNKCKQLFPNTKIYIVAQNWGSFHLENYSNVWVVNFENALGIVNARIKLRDLFLDYSNADYLIMLDDDCELYGCSGAEYLKQIDENPDCFIEFNKTLLKLFAISRKIFSQVNYNSEINPENGDGFEDRIFVNLLRKRFPESRREFKETGISEISVSGADIYSTWYKEQDLKDMLEKTAKSIQDLDSTSLN